MSEPFSSEEQYLIDESSEIAVGERLGWAQKLLSAFPAFKSKNYVLYFGGQFVSLIGTWLQVVAQGWLVLQLTHSAFLIGLVAALSSLPSLLFSLHGGVIVDRYPKKTIVICTQVASMVLAFILGILTMFHSISVFEIAILSFLLGIVNAVDMPARQAYTVELVDKEGLASAIALNSGVFNAARVIGPSVAGFLIAFIGTGGAFLLNGVSYIAVIIALFFINTPLIAANRHLDPMKAIKEGITYSFSHPKIRMLLVFAGVVSIFGWSYGTILPVIAQDTFHLDATGLGYLYAANGLGALVATLVISCLSDSVSPIVFILGGNSLFAVSLLIFSITHSVPVAMFFLFSSGLGLLAQFAVINTTIQNVVEDSMRGRVMSIYSLMFIGLSPVGNIEVGYIAQRFGSEVALRFGAIIVLLFGIYIYFQRHAIRDVKKSIPD